MTTLIKQLPNVLINKIAAGEVIERPASVVKELVENSLDAGATSIYVTIKEGGLTSMEVNDNGSGMSPADLQLAIQRHCTSKLIKPDDLFNINSFGFRGEALPSITSVSHFTIKSRLADSDTGYQIKLEGGEIIEESEVGCDYGTYISVKNLFYNTPARRKFMKSYAAEMRAITKMMEWLSLANSQAQFVLESDKRRLLDLSPAKDIYERSHQLFGLAQADKFVSGEKYSDSLKIEIYLSKPEICRRKRSRIVLLVNGRRIESKSLFAAIMSAYGEFLPSGVYPQGAVFITISPELIDVNVHPAKSEIRFSDERVIFHILYRLVRESLLGSNIVPLFSPRSGGRSDSPVSDSSLTDSRRNAIQQFFQNNSGAGQKGEEALSSLFMKTESDTSVQHLDSNHSSEPLIDNHKSAATFDTGKVNLGYIRFQQMGNLYLIAISNESIMIIDQHAAHERILYELAMESFKSSSIVSQNLLFPVNIHLEADDFSTWQREKNSLEKLGFKVSEFGPRQIQIESAPASLGEQNPEILFKELLDDFSDISGDEEKRYKKKAASFACRASVMAGDRLNDTEMRALVDNLLKAKNPYICPHGRPTMIQISKSELDIKFGRL